MTEHPDDLLHIASCRTCRDRFTADNVVNVEADRHREPERMREFLETARRLEREREGVKDVVARLLRATPAAEWSTLAASPELRSSAAVEQLIEEIRNRGERMPAEALTLANVATSVSEALPAATYPAVVLAQLRATAWKERAHALRYLGRFHDALKSAETAEQRLNDFAAATFDRAIVYLTKAMILHKVDRDVEAKELLRSCRQIFEEHGDSKMLLCAGMIEANFLYNEDRHGEAQKLYRELRDIAREIHDAESAARIESNLGYCATHSGDFRAANIHFSNSIALFNDIGRPLEATRAERGAGRILVAKGQINPGIAYLRSAREAFIAAGIAEDAALCGLEIVESLVQRGDTPAARDLAHKIAGEVAAAGLSQAAVTALERLEENLREGGTELAIHVRTVHAFLESLQEATPAH
jgi:tetratricopeptide (TPR) repeat protein